MKCYVCQSPGMFSVNNTVFAGANINYVAHTLYGVEMLGCQNCGFVSVEFVHPQTLKLFYESPVQNQNTDTLSRQHADISRKQADFFKANLPSRCNRVLFFSAGRGLHVQHYARMANELFISELVPAVRDLACSNIRTNGLDETQLKGDDLAGTFDLIILSNVLQRLPFPRSQLALCARLLKQGGHLAFEVPITTLEEVQTGNFGREEMNFFTTYTLQAMIRTQGSFSAIQINIDEIERDDPSAMGGGVVQSLPRQTAQVILNNERPVAELPPSDIAPEDLIPIMGKLSFGCFVSANSASVWSDRRPKKQRVVVLDPSAHI